MGQGAWEEVDRIQAGGNYGWNVFEGYACFPIGTEDCAGEGMTEPTYVYEHERGNQRSVTGGVVYRGSRLPELVGRYLFADYELGAISALQLPAAGERAEKAIVLTSGPARC